MACFHCDCKRPPDAFLENKEQETHHRFTESQKDRVVKRDDVSNAWNFDFDDDESDGAEVAAFEYADSTRKNENFTREGLRDPEDDDDFGNLPPGARESSDLGSSRSRKPGAGFDDFDDEDDIDSYEIDETGGREGPVAGTRSFVAPEEYSEDEMFPESNANRGGTSKLHNNRNNKRGNGKGGDDDELGFSSDDDNSVAPRWKSSHVASTQRGPPFKKMSFGSDDEFGLDSDQEEDGPRSGLRPGGQRNNDARRGFKGKRSSYSASESDDDMDDQAYRGSRGNRGGRTRGGRGGFNDSFASDSYRGSSGSSANRSRGRGGRTGGNRRSGFDSDGEDYRGSSSSASRSRGNREDSGGFGGRMGSRRGGFDDEFDRKSRSSRGRGSGSFRGSNRGGRGRGRGGGGNRREQSDGKDTDFGDFRNSRRVIER